MAASALWTSIYNDVLTLTNSPHLVDETNLGIRQATLRAHSCDKFPRDLVITSVVAPASATPIYNLAINTTTEFDRFRDVAAVQLLDVDGVAMDAPVVELVEIGDLYDPGYPGVRKPWVSWLAGTSLNVYAAGGLLGASVQWWQSPILASEAYTSWVASLFPDIIVWQAARTVWNRSGNEAKAREADQILGDKPPMNMASGLFHDFKANFLTTAGR